MSKQHFLVCLFFVGLLVCLFFSEVCGRQEIHDDDVPQISGVGPHGASAAANPLL